MDLFWQCGISGTHLTFVVLQVPLWHPEMPDGSLYQKRICTFHEATCWPTLVKTIDLNRVSAAFILLVIYFSRYDGPPALTKYDIQETKIEVSLVSLKCNKFYLNWSKVVVLEDVEAIRVTITLGRKLLGVLLNVFVPTTILNLIGFSTNFYKVTDGGSLFYDDTWLLKSKFMNEAQDAYFESVIAINLTSMLVLVALFVQVSK